MKKLLFSLCIIFFPFVNLYSQIEEEIFNYIDSTEIIFTNGNKMLLAEIRRGNPEKASEVFHFLIDKAKQENYQAFSTLEKIYALSILEEWELWLETAKSYSSDYQQSRTNLHQSIQDDLFNFLVTKSTELREKVLLMNFTDEEKDLFELFFELIQFGTSDYYYQLVSNFEHKYPGSAYSGFLDAYFPKKKGQTAFNFGFGTQLIAPSQQLADYFNYSALFSMSMDFAINKTYVSLFLGAGNLKLQKAFTGSTQNDVFDFKMGEDFSYFEGGIAGGYFLVRSKHLQLAPFVDFGGSYLRSSRFEPIDSEYEFEVFNHVIFGGGIHTELLLATFSPKNYMTYNPYYMPMNSYISLKFDAGYHVLANFSSEQFRGDLPFARLALVYGFGDF